jgi:vitamin B12 transporter
MRKTVLGLVAVLMSMNAAAQDSLKTKTLQEVVVTGTRYDVPVEKSGKSITKFNRVQLDQMPEPTLGGVLNTVTGVQADGVFGTPGTNISYYVRGARNRQSVILLDGMPLLDASGISVEYDLRFLSLSNVEQVEVMRGGLSTLYGTGAAASVINLTSRKIPLGTRAQLDLQAGSFGTYSQNVSFSVSRNRWYSQVMLNNVLSEGFSSASDARAATAFDDDGMKRKNAFLVVGMKPSQVFDWQVFASFDKFMAEYDDGPFTDAANKQRSNQWRVGLRGSWMHKHGELRLMAQQSRVGKEFKSSFPDEYTSYVQQVELFDTYHLSPASTLLGGISFQRFSYSQPETVSADSMNFTIVDPYITWVLDLESGLNVHTGVRLNTHSVYGVHAVYNLNPSYLITVTGEDKIKVSGSISTSYTTPSLYQLFSFYGNDDLEPEETFNAEGGLTWYGKNVTLGLVYFSRREDSSIGFRSFFDDNGNFIGGEYFNLGSQREVTGVELEGRYTISSAISVNANYAYTSANKRNTFYRIPSQKVNAGVQLSNKTGGQVGIQYQYTGQRYDMDYSIFEEVSLNDFHLLDVIVSQTFFNSRLRTYASCKNLLDSEYTWVPGYNTMARNYTIGLTYRWE